MHLITWRVKQRMTKQVKWIASMSEEAEKDAETAADARHSSTFGQVSKVSATTTSKWDKLMTPTSAARDAEMAVTTEPKEQDKEQN